MNAWALLRRLILVASISFPSAASCDETARQKNSAGSGISPKEKHGSAQVLSERLFRIREIETQIRSVTAPTDSSFSAESMESLQKIFASTSDVFRIDSDAGNVSSIRAEAMAILKTAPPAAQRNWIQSTRVFAESSLQQAINTGTSPALAATARQFPLTESGATAAITRITKEFLQGRTLESRAMLDQLELDYRDTVLMSFVQQRSTPLRSRIEGVLTGAGAQEQTQASSPTSLSVSTSSAPGSLSPPWPKQKWQWRESVWDYPGAPQPTAGSELDAFFPGTSISLNEFYNWRPVFWGQSLVMRTPFRLVAFDRRTGQQLWSVPTDTYTPAVERDQNHDDEDDGPGSLNRRYRRYASEPSPIGGLAAFGMLSSDDEYLYFVDHFDFFRSTEEFNFNAARGLQNPLRLGIGDDENTNANAATRIVALRKDPAGGMPQVAWTAGDSNPFVYQPVQGNTLPAANTATDAPGKAKSEQATKSDEPIASKLKATTDNPAVENIAAENPDAPRALSVSDHKFLSPPIGAGQRLFVLSAYNDLLWVSSLARGTGQVLWQQPLLFGDDQMSVLQQSLYPVQTTSLCLLSGDTVVCSFSAGVLVGVRATDGHLQWATAIREEALPVQMRGFRLQGSNYDDEIAIDSPAVIVPVASDSMVVCTDSQSARLYGVDTTSGEIRWVTSRRAFGPGDVGGSADLYIAGISGNQAILIGERHCRSVNLKTGDQNWVVPIAPTIGRAECRGERCLIPLAEGQMLTLSLSDGREIRQRSTFLPDDAKSAIGAITSDDELICASTPVSLMVFARADSFLKEPSDDEPVTEKNADEAFARVQAFLINGDTDKAVDLLMQVANADAETFPEHVQKKFEQTLGELILLEWGEQSIAQRDIPASDALKSINGVPREELLPTLNLTSEQQLRAAVLIATSRPDTRLTAEDIRELSAFREWKQPVSITETWKVRPDILLQRLSSSDVDAETQFSELSLVKLRRLAEDVILFPDRLGTDERRMAFIDRLIGMGEFAAAESVAASWQQNSGSAVASNILSQIRERDVIAGYVAGDEDDSGNLSKNTPNNAAENANGHAGLTSKTSAALKIESQAYLSQPELDLQRVEKGLAITSLPDWVRLRHFLVDGPENLPELVSMDVSDGSIRDRVSLPFAFHRNSISFQRLNNSLTTPGLLPVAGADQMLMISCAVPDKAGILWTRRTRNRNAEESTIEFGPLGADHFVWHLGDELHCTHPLTGRDTWVRKLRLSPASRPMAGVRRIFGDKTAVVVMGTDASSYERFSTRDGQSLGVGRLSIGRISDAVTVGACLLYPDNNSRLHLFNGATGRDELEDDDPIMVGRHNPDSMFQVLSEGRVVTVSSTLEVILIDTNAGKVIFRTPASALVPSKVVFGVSAFERHGRLFVGLEDSQDLALRSVEAAFRPHEPRIGAGPLLCLNPKTGEILWHKVLANTVVPMLYGDPTDLMVMWSVFRPEDVNQGDQKGQKLNVDLINSQNGDVLVRRASITASRPVRCVHHAATSTIEMVTKDTVITIRPESADDETE